MIENMFYVLYWYLYSELDILVNVILRKSVVKIMRKIVGNEEWVSLYLIIILYVKQFIKNNKKLILNCYYIKRNFSTNN
jgi:hypothetical protein